MAGLASLTTEEQLMAVVRTAVMQKDESATSPRDMSPHEISPDNTSPCDTEAAASPSPQQSVSAIASHQGYLMLTKAHVRHGRSPWKRRFCSVVGGSLVYHKSKAQESLPKVHAHIGCDSTIEAVKDGKVPFMFRLTAEGIA